MQRINVGHKSLADYRSLIGATMADEIKTLAEPLRGRRMLHLSATAFGGGVAEIQYTLLPLLNDVGIDAEWRVIEGRDEFFDVTKTIHNGLQGDPRGLTEEQREVFVRYNQLNADALEDADEWDMIVVHDPQPAMIRDMVQSSRPKWVWRCHIDLSSPNPEVLGFLAPALGNYDAAIFHMHEYIPAEAHLHRGRGVAAGDRSARAQEHGAGAGGRRLHRRSVRDRSRAAADAAGVAVRPVEGPQRRDRRLP